MPVAAKTASDDLLRRATALLQLAQAGGTTALLRDDLARMALVMAVAAIDTYLHVLVTNRLNNHRKALPPSLRAVRIGFAELADLGERVTEAQRLKRKIRPWVAVKSALREQLLVETFQSFEQAGRALSMAGAKKVWEQVATAGGVTTPDIQKRLNAIAHRRNRIVHEGDLKRLDRPRTIVHSPVKVAAVQDDITWIGALIASIDTVVS